MTGGLQAGIVRDDAARRELVAWLRRRDGRTPVELFETHISWVAMHGDRVYKARKHVELPFIDLSTPELRRRDCERELEVNRRFAPDVYLGIVDVTDAVGTVVDAAVEMRRMPTSERLSALAGHGARAEPCLDQLAVDIAEYHAAAPRGPHIDAAATRDAVAKKWRTELGELERFGDDVLDRALLAEVEALVTRFLDGREDVFASRIAAGRVCDGHGDLLADDIFCTREGPRILDAIEFDDHLRWTDTLADVAFLAMDLERLGRRDLARRFLDRYRVEAGDEWPASLEGQYLAHRAVVRCKIACLRYEQGDTGAGALARRLLALAWSHLRETRVRLVLVGGPPGTGKSTISRRLADELGWTLVRSDVVRKESAGLAPAAPASEPLDEGLYSGAVTAQTYDALLDAANNALSRGESVVLDASWSDARWRDRARDLADETASELIALRCDAPRDVADARIVAREREGSDASDAGPAVAAAMRARFAPWPGASVVDTAGPIDAAVAAARHAVR